MTIQGQAIERTLDSSRPSFPATIAFLEGHGVERSCLEKAAALATTEGVPADVALIAAGLVDEESFYRFLAAEIGAPFFREIVADRRAQLPGSITAGISPLAPNRLGAGFALAPRGAQVTRLLRLGAASTAEYAITTPSALGRGVIAARAPTLARTAAYALPEAAPHRSMEARASLPQRVVLATGGGAMGCLGTMFPTETLMGVTALFCALFLGMVWLRLAAAVERIGVKPATFVRSPDRLLPIYTVIVPLYREARVLPRLLTALEHLDYPKSKLQVMLVVEADDAETRTALAELALPSWVEVVVAPLGAPRTKPRALNVALELARGEFTVVFDAEDVPEPDQLRLAVSTFGRAGADVAALQARLVVDNTDDTWLTRLFTVEYATLFDVINPALATMHLPVPLGGTSNHLRTAVLRGLYGWDAWNVTEDADLGIRLALAGYRVADLPSSTLEEAPAVLRSWMRQRTRWMKGFMQVCITHSRRPASVLRELGPARFAGAVAVTFGTVATALGYPIFTAVALGALIQGGQFRAATPVSVAWVSIALTLFVYGALAMTIPAVVALKRRRWWRLLPLVPLLPLYHALVSAAAWRALVELVLDPDHWHKTEHGLARTSRSGLLASGGDRLPHTRCASERADTGHQGPR